MLQFGSNHSSVDVIAFIENSFLSVHHQIRMLPFWTLSLPCHRAFLYWVMRGRVAVFGLLLLPNGLCVLGQPPQDDAVTNGSALSDAAAQDTAAQKQEQDAASMSATDVEYWVSQLSHDDFLRRELAQRKLIHSGASCVPELYEAIGNGDLETVQRSSLILAWIATSSDPADDGGAWQHLVNLSRQSVGMVATTARQAANEVRQHRTEMAVGKLRAAGVDAQVGEFSLGSSVVNGVQRIKIDGGWNGDTRSLQWLQWVDGVQNVTLAGPAVTPAVLDEVIRMPELKSLAMINEDKPLPPGSIEILMGLDSIEQLEFRYVTLTQTDAQRIGLIPVQYRLSLTGSGLDETQIDIIRAARPHVELEYRRGGFLGIHCDSANGSCQIAKVIPDSAAQIGGLIRGDIITVINGQPVKQFAELQAIVGKHVAGDELTIEYQRQQQQGRTVLRLRRQASN